MKWLLFVSSPSANVTVKAVINARNVIPTNYIPSIITDRFFDGSVHVCHFLYRRVDGFSLISLVKSN